MKVICTRLLLSALLALPGLAAQAQASSNTVPFEYRGGHLLCVPVKINNSVETKFILDTGAGVNVISSKLAKQLACKSSGLHSGKRMSGQLLTMKICRLKKLRFGSAEHKNVPAAIWNTDDLFGHDKEFAGVQGIISLEFFRKQAFTIDYKNSQIILESKETLQQRQKGAARSSVKIEPRFGVECGIKIPVTIPKFPKLMAEVDTGSSSLILDYRYLKALNIRRAKIKREYGKDETGHAYMRYFTTLPGAVCLKEAPAIKQESPAVMFQKIIHDGLIGDTFLKQFTVSFDLEHSQMFFAK